MRLVTRASVRAAARSLGRVAKALLVVAVFAAALLAFDLVRFLTQPVATSEAVQLVVPYGADFRDAVARLAAAGVFAAPRQREYFTAYALVTGDTARIKSGEYRIAPDATPIALLNQLVAGRTVSHRLTIVEGWTFAELRAAIAAHDAIRHTLAGKSGAAVMKALGHPGQHPEGRFLPDTYLFPRGATDVAFLKRAYAAMQDYLAEQWATRQPGLPLASPYEALILASIIEKETGQAGERARIAGVFVRRLQQDMPLQTDPTVIYGVKASGQDYHGDLTRAHLTTDTPYNTYTRPGLPPTPIALPGRAAIAAALHPAEGDALFFVARGDGSHAFSATYAQHREAVRKYQLQP